VNKNRFALTIKYVPYVFVLPFIVSFLVFYLYPITQTVIMSFQNVVPGETSFIGLANYAKIFDSDFLDALRVSFTYTALTILVLIPLPVVLSVLLNNGLKRVNSAFRALFFLPSLVSVVVAGTIFRLMFASSGKSMVNSLLVALGGQPVDWLMGGAGSAMFLMVMVAVWRWTGVNVIYFMSGLQTIPAELYEAAEIDGAGPVGRFRHITLPLLKPTIIFVTTISVFGGFAMFEESFIFWAGLSPNNVGLTMVGLLYKRGFQQGDLGLASGVGIFLMLIVFAVSVIQLKFFGFFKKED
jgi:arabinosaccharide transport system permease protein